MRRVVPLLIVLSLGFAPAPVYRPKPVRGDLKAMQGIWVYQAEPNAKPGPIVKWEFADHQLLGEPAPPQRTEIELDESTTPKGFTFWLTSSTRRIAVRGIYKLEGGVLTVCYHRADYTRAPASFSAATSSGNDVFTLCAFKREKP